MPLLVSIIIPTYNSARFLPDAVSSAFAQTYPYLECIVVDDGSTDNTRDLLQQLLIRYPALKTAAKENGGPSSARNLGLRLCSGDLVSFLDADDVLLPDKIQRQINFMEEHLEVDFVYGDYLVVTETLKPIAIFSAELPRNLHPLDALCYRNWFNPLVPLIRRRVLDRVGEFDEELLVAEDWDYWIRCAKVVHMTHLDGAVAMYRQHPQQVHRDYAHMREACMRVVTKHFRQDGRRRRSAMAAIDLNDAKHCWKHSEYSASVLALMRYAVQDRFGLHTGGLWPQVTAMMQSQLKPL